MFHFWNFQQILNIFKEKQVVIANALPKLQNVKDLVRPHSKKRHFRISFDRQHVKLSRTFRKSTWEHFYHSFSSIWGEIICKMSLLGKFVILGVFVNIGNADDKYPVRDCEDLRLVIQRQLSSKQKRFSQPFISFQKFSGNYKHFQKKKTVIANVFPKLPNVKDLVRSDSKMRHFRTSFDSQHVTASETLVKSVWEHFYNIFSLVWGDIIWKMSPLVKFEILALFLLKHWLLMTNILFRNARIFSSLFKYSYVKNKKLFLNFFSIDEIYIKF